MALLFDKLQDLARKMMQLVLMGALKTAELIVQPAAVSMQPCLRVKKLYSFLN